MQHIMIWYDWLTSCLLYTSGAMASSAWYGVEFQKGTGNDGSTYYRGLFNNKNDDSKHLYAEWTYKNGGDTYQVEVPNSHIEDCSSYYKY